MYYKSLQNKFFALIVFAPLFIQQTHAMDLGEQEQRKIPRLSELAFIALKPKLNKQIMAIANSNQPTVKKLQELRPFMDTEKQIAHYTQNHPRVRMLIDKQAEQHCHNLTSAKPIAIPSMPHFDQQINAISQSNFLKNHYDSLPTPHNQKSCVYAACLLNNGFLFAPVHSLLSALLHTTDPLDLETIHLINGQLALMSQAGKFALTQKIDELIAEQRAKELTKIHSTYPSHTQLLFSNIPTYTVTYKPSNITYDHEQTTSYAETNKKLDRLQLLAQQGLTQHFDTVYSQDRKKVAVSSTEGTIIYCLDTSNPIPAIRINRNDIKKMCFSQDGNFFSITCGKQLSIYDLVQLEPVGAYSFDDTKTIQALCATKSNDITILQSDETTHSFSFCSFDLQKQTWGNNYVRPLDDAGTSVTAASFSHDGELMAVGCSNGKLLLIDRLTETTLWTLHHSNPVPINKIIFSGDNSIITTLVNESTACIWHTASGKCIKQFSLGTTQKMTGTVADRVTISKKEYPYHLYAPQNPSIAGRIAVGSQAMIDHYMPIVLLNISVDEESLDLSQLEASNTIVWKKTISANKLMLQKKLDNCGTVSALLQFQKDLAESKNFSPYLQKSYNQKIADKIEILLPQEIEHRSKCDRAARAFLLYTPKWTLNHVFRTFAMLHKDAKALVLQKACDTQNLFALFFTRPKDIFVATLQKIIPQYELKSKVAKSDSQFTEYKNGYPEHKRAVLGPAPAQSAPKPTKSVSTYAAQQELFKKNSVEAFCTLSEYGEQKLITIDDLVEDPSHKDSFKSDFGYYHDDGDLSRSYGLSFNDYIRTTVDQRALLQKIADGHNAGKYGNVDKRYKMTPEDIKLLMPIKDIIDNNDLYKYLQIGVDFPPKTTYDKVKDMVLLAIPLSIAEGVVPQIIHNNVNGNMQGVLGGIASSVSGYVVGKWFFPFFDGFNSSALKTRTWFGDSNKTTVQKAESFAALGLFHSIMHAIAEKFLSWQTLPYQALGYAMHGARLLSSACNLVDFRSYVARGSLLHTFATMFHLKKYEHPLHRRNKDDKSYTLGDLLDAQTNNKTQ